MSVEAGTVSDGTRPHDLDYDFQVSLACLKGYSESI